MHQPGTNFEFHSSLSYPEGYQKYEDMLSGCSWSTRAPLINVTKQNLVHEYNEPSSYHTYAYKYGKKFDSVVIMASICRIFGHVTPSGPVEYVITRAGPIQLSAESGVSIFFIPGRPTTSTKHNHFLTASFDWTRDTSGNLIQYPPIHHHHSATDQVGGAFSDDLDAFEAFNPVRQPTKMAKSSSQFPAADPDLICPEYVQNPYACAYLKMPPGIGIMQDSQIDLWAEGMVNNVGKTTVDLFLEFGRQWTPQLLQSANRNQAIAKLFKRAYSLYFTTTGGRELLSVPLAYQESMAWHTYQMPEQGNIHGSWLHTHSQSPSEVWILSTQARSLLPTKLLSRVDDQRATPIEPLNLTLLHIQSRIMRFNSESLKCRYRSRMSACAKPRCTIDVDVFKRGGRRFADLGARCDNWPFKRGDFVTIMAFIKRMPYISIFDPFPGHHHWYAVATFERHGRG